MNRSEMHIGQKVRLPAKDIVTYSENKDGNLTKNVRHQEEKTMYVRELHDSNCAGLSYTMEQKNCYGILYEAIESHKNNEDEK